MFIVYQRRILQESLNTSVRIGRKATPVFGWSLPHCDRSVLCLHRTSVLESAPHSDCRSSPSMDELHDLYDTDNSSLDPSVGSSENAFAAEPSPLTEVNL